MFVIGDAFFEKDDKMKKTSIKEGVTSTLREVGPNITLTSITNACGFFLAAIIPIPAMRYFAIQVWPSQMVLSVSMVIDTSVFITGWNCCHLQLFCNSVCLYKFYRD